MAMDLAMAMALAMVLAIRRSAHKYNTMTAEKDDRMSLRKLSNAATGGTWHGVGYMVETDNDSLADPASCNAAMYGQDGSPRHLLSP